jgi:hypothetical protein
MGISYATGRKGEAMLMRPTTYWLLKVLLAVALLSAGGWFLVALVLGPLLILDMWRDARRKLPAVIRRRRAKP